MRKKPISHLVIAGGGTAGWSTAAILSSLPGLRITVLEPSDIPTIGVGESTLPHIHLAHQKMGFEVFKSADWLDSVDGTIKLTIEFAEFEAKDKLWVHPFFDAYGLDRGWLTDRLLRGLPSDTEQEQASFMFAHTSAGRRRMRGFIDNASWFSQAACSKEAAFHMNALAYAKSLKAMTLQRPQVQVLDDAIGAVTQGADGSIESLILRSGASLTADLYVDCTGSSAMLLHALDEPWVSAHERLFVDGAWLIQLPYRDRTPSFATPPIVMRSLVVGSLTSRSNRGSVRAISFPLRIKAMMRLLASLPCICKNTTAMSPHRFRFAACDLPQATESSNG